MAVVLVHRSTGTAAKAVLKQLPKYALALCLGDSVATRALIAAPRSTQMDDTPPTNSSRGRLLALVVIAALLAGSFWLVRKLGSASALQDCVATGRHDCGS